MRYYKRILDGYLQSVGTGAGGTEITESEYNEIMAVIHNKPEATEAIDYRLKENLTWEAYEVEPISEPEEADPEEIINILTGEEEA